MRTGSVVYDPITRKGTIVRNRLYAPMPSYEYREKAENHKEQFREVSDEMMFAGLRKAYHLARFRHYKRKEIEFIKNI